MLMRIVQAIHWGIAQESQLAAKAQAGWHSLQRTEHKKSLAVTLLAIEVLPLFSPPTQCFSKVWSIKPE